MADRSKEVQESEVALEDLPVDALLTPQQLAALDAELAETEPATASIAGRVAEYFNPPPDLNDRAVGRIKGSMVNRETMMLAADLFSVGWRTTRVVVSPPAPDED